MGCDNICGVMRCCQCWQNEEKLFAGFVLAVLYTMYCYNPKVPKRQNVGQVATWIDCAVFAAF